MHQGGRYKVEAYVRRRGVLLDLQARKLTVRVTMNEAEVQRRMAVERADIERGNAENDAGALPLPRR